MSTVSAEDRRAALKALLLRNWPARARIGRALREARWRREHDDDRFGFAYPDRIAPRALLLRRPSRTGIQILSALGLIALLVALFYFPPAIPGGLPAAAPQPQTSLVPTTVDGGGRGRTTSTIAPVVVTQPTAVPTPATAAPATAIPSPGTGAGTGTGAGQLPPRLSTDDRFIFVVLDSDTRRPIEGVCVTYGNQCTATARKTNKDGVWWIDFPRDGSVAKLWLFEFWMNGYEPQGRQVPYAPGEPVPPVEILMRRVS